MCNIAFLYNQIKFFFKILYTCFHPYFGFPFPFFLSNFNKVSGASQANFELIADDFSKEKKRYAEIMEKEGKKFNSFLEKNNIPKPELQSKEEFLKKG